MDLAIGIVVVLASAVLAFFAGRACGGLKPKNAPDLIALGAVLAIGAHGWWGRDSVLLARVLPFSNLIVLSNLFPPLIGLIAGVMWEKKATPTWRRVIYVAGLAATAGYSIVAPFLGPVPACNDHWEGDLCMQTTSASCSAACAATLLKAQDIDASEGELAQLCLTRKGTSWQGLYRGLKLKTASTDCAVEVFSGSVDDLRKVTPGPVILTVGIPTGANVPPIYEERYSWRPGMLHSVVLYDFAENGRVNMGDPSIGHEQWTVEDLQILYRGMGLRVVRK